MHCLPKRPIKRLLVLTMVWLGLAIGVVDASDTPDMPLPPQPNSLEQTTSPLRMLMNFVSRADGARCPMYPTCSHYARQAFAEKGLIMGWVLTSDRLLRCGRDETRLAPPVYVHGEPHAYDPLAANIFWWDKP